MTLASRSFPASGRGPYNIIGLDYLLAAHLVVDVNGTPVAATVDAERRTVTLAAAGTTVTVTRVTPRKREERLTQFLDLPNGVGGLTAALLDQDYRQNMLLAAEGDDHVSATDMPDNSLVLDGTEWDGEGRKVQSLVGGSSPDDIVIKSQLDTVVAAVRNLPTAVLDADDGLMVVAGEWDDQAPAAFRTALSLASTALLTAGTGASQVPQFAAGTPPLYATADGRNINLASHAIQTEINKRARATVVRWSIQNFVGPGVDPSSPTWSQNASTRIALQPGWAGRVELNNSGDVDGSEASPRRIKLTAGTWRIKWLFKVLMPLVASNTNKTSMRLTSDDDTSGQIIYYDLGLHRPSVDFVDLDWSVFADSVILSSASAFNITFRFTNFHSSVTDKCDFALLVHKVSTSLAS